jgi:hypothetical protein
VASLTHVRPFKDRRTPGTCGAGGPGWWLGGCDSTHVSGHCPKHLRVPCYVRPASLAAPQGVRPLYARVLGLHRKSGRRCRSELSEIVSGPFENDGILLQ